MWSIDCKGFHFNNDKFTAIVPIWSDYARQYKMYPVNHIKLTGAVWRVFDNDLHIYQQQLSS